MGLTDMTTAVGQLDYEIGSTVVALAMERSRYSLWEEVMPLQRTESGRSVSDTAQEIQQIEAQRSLRAASDPCSLRLAIKGAERFEELATDILSARTHLATLDAKVENRVRSAISAGELDQVISLLCEVDGWQAADGSPAASWLARLNEAAASILDEHETQAQSQWPR